MKTISVLQMKAYYKKQFFQIKKNQLTTMKFFQNCYTLDEVKKLYRDLAKQWHPDKGGNTQVMQEINTEYIKAIAYVARIEKNYKGQDRTETEIETEILQAEAYREAVNKIIHLQGIKIELVGCWLWVTGDTKQHADILKAQPQKFTWAKKRSDYSAWFFRTNEYKVTNRGQRMSMDAIRNKYGSTEVKQDDSNFLYN